MAKWIPRTTLDDGQVIEGYMEDMTQSELISYANQLMRSNRKPEAREIMRYQHAKFVESYPIDPPPTKAA